MMGNKMQNIYGTTEAIATNGTLVSNCLTWDSKITSVVGYLGGLGPILRKYMIKDNTYYQFYNIINNHYQTKFTYVVGDSVSYSTPNNIFPLPDYNSDFTSCRGEFLKSSLKSRLVPRNNSVEITCNEETRG